MKMTEYHFERREIASKQNVSQFTGNKNNVLLKTNQMKSEVGQKI